MNYQKIYDQLIEKRKNNKLSKKDCYCEEHHIIPLSEGGPDTKDNKINLSAREHYIAHLLLAKIYDDIKMYSAINYMQSGGIKNRNFKYNNRLYGKMKEEYGKKQKGKKLSEEIRRKISEAVKGKLCGEKNPMYGKNIKDYMTEEAYLNRLNKLSEKMKGKNNPMWGRKHSEQTKQKLRKPKSEIHRQHLRESQIKFPVIQYTKDFKFVKEYESSHEAERKTKINKGNILSCCKGERNSAGGFRWAYKNSI